MEKDKDMNDDTMDSESLRQAFRSDALDDIRDLVKYWEQNVEEKREGKAVRELRPFEIDLIIDANAAVREIYWLVELREKPHSRTAIQECVDAGTVNLYAPQHLDDEVKDKIPVVAERNDVDEEQLFSQWSDYKEYITFRQVSEGKIELAEEKVTVSDSDDLPYIALQVDLESAIVSEDAHIQEMGEAVLIDGVRGLRDYSRAASVKYHLSMGGAFIGILSFRALSVLWDGISSLVAAFTDAPRWVQFGIAGIVALGIANPNSRDQIKKVLSSAKSATGGFLEEMWPVVRVLAEEVEEADEMVNRFQAAHVLKEESAEVPHGGGLKATFNPSLLHRGDFSRPPLTEREPVQNIFSTEEGAAQLQK